MDKKSATSPSPLGKAILKALRNRSQHWLAAQLGIAPHHLSEIVNGKRGLSSRTAADLAAILELNIEEVCRLDNLGNLATQRAVQLYQQRQWPWPNIGTFIDEMRTLASTALTLRHIGEPQLAADQLSYVDRHLGARLGLNRDHARDIRQLKAVRIQALDNTMYCYNDIMLRHETLREVLPIHRTVRAIAGDIGDSEGLAWAELHLADSYYIGRDSRRSAAILKPLEVVDSPKLLAQVLRMAMLNYGYLEDRSELKAIERIFRNKLEDGTIDSDLDIAAVLEGSGRARAVLRMPGAEKRLEEAQQYTEKAAIKGLAMPPLNIQIHNSELIRYVEEHDRGKGIDLDRAALTAREGYKLAKVHGFKRHMLQIRNNAHRLGVLSAIRDLL